MQCTDHSGCFPPLEKGRSHTYSAALPTFFCGSSCVAVFLCFYATDCEAYSYATDGYGIFNVRTTLGACRTTRTSLHKSGLGRTETTLFFTLFRQGIEPWVLGLSFQRSSTELRTPLPPIQYPYRWVGTDLNTLAWLSEVVTNIHEL